MIAISGGVDSSVAALLIKEQGYRAAGVTLRLFNNEDIGISRENTCCSLEDVADARSVAGYLSIPYYVYNFTGRFKQEVIDRFVAAYLAGETPNPCIDCNRYIKFSHLFDRARQLYFDYVATGHYSIIERDSGTGRYLLKQAADRTKDQSYVLYSMTQDQLARTKFPLGSLTKQKVREIAEQNGFINARKRDSQDICFVPDGDYAAFIRRFTGKTFATGDFVDKSGRRLGTHKGILHYTIGQRKGLGIASPDGLPFYVCDILPAENRVVLGHEEDLYAKNLTAHQINLIATDKIAAPMKVMAKIRYRQQAQPATVIQTDEDRLRVAFDSPQRAITKGQSVVLYADDYVVGGGIIC